MKELSIFIDESGDWGEYDYKSPFYIVTMVFHNQIEDISENLLALNERLRYIGCEERTLLMKLMLQESWQSYYQDS